MSIRGVRIGDPWIGNGRCYAVARIGSNHNGNVGLAKHLVRAADWAGCDAVDFRKRTPELCLPAEQWGLPYRTPRGTVSQIDAARRAELGMLDYVDLDTACREHDILWFASCDDEPAVDLIELLDPPCYKIDTANVADRGLLRHIRSMGRPIVLATDHCTLRQLDGAVDTLGTEELIILHTTAANPAGRQDLTLRVIPALQQRYRVPVGYSGNNTGTATALAAVALGACMVELPLTLDCGMWGGDHATSIEPGAVARLVRELRSAEAEVAPNSTAA
jgi:N-acetylneuraminate synthase